MLVYLLSSYPSPSLLPSFHLSCLSSRLLLSSSILLLLVFYLPSHLLMVNQVVLMHLLVWLEPSDHLLWVFLFSSLFSWLVKLMLLAKEAFLSFLLWLVV